MIIVKLYVIEPQGKTVLPATETQLVCSFSVSERMDEQTRLNEKNNNIYGVS